MIIRKRPIISWLLNMDDKANKIQIPLLKDEKHVRYLLGGMNLLTDVCTTRPNWGLPELVMPSFEEVMGKSAKSFFNIDHQLFQEFYNDNVCGILLTRDNGTIVYGFGENTLHIWLFREINGISCLCLYFYVVSKENNHREIYTWPTLINDEELFNTDLNSKEQIYENLANRIITFLAVKKYVKVDTIVVPTGDVVKLNNLIPSYKSKEKVKNESGQQVIVMDSRWFRKIVNDNEIFVRGFFRFQNKKNERGEWYKELIFVDSYIRNGYHRNALIEEK